MNDAPQPRNVYQGIPASSGIVIGKAYVLDPHLICVLKRDLDGPAQIDAEIERFREAVERSAEDMASLTDRALAEFGDDVPNMIFETHVQLLRDPSLVKEVETHIETQAHNAEWALKVLMEKYQARFSRFKDPYFRERLEDIEQVVTRLQRRLSGGGDQSGFDQLTEPVVIVAHDLSPADTMLFDPRKVIGFATDSGGKTSHAGILASSMDIPAVVGLKGASFDIRSGDPIIVDGNTGVVIHRPTMSQFQTFNQRRQRWLYLDKAIHAEKGMEAVTTDGVRVQVMANIESSLDLAHLKEHGAEGVGLYRTEYLYINRPKWPDEDEQFEDYKRVAESVAPHYAVIRTLDIGGDKLPVASPFTSREANPALGLRAIRFCLQHRDIFRTQLRAILRASAFGKLRIMYPLITTLREVREANAFLDLCRAELDAEGIAYDRDIPVGIMIETPSSVMQADELAKNCSFFSIGTNDLIQYTMAIDRVNERVAYLYQPLSPAIIHMIHQVITAAQRRGIDVSVCGKMAGDPAYAMLLLGMGEARSLSMDVHSIPRLKKFIRHLSLEDCKQVARTALSIHDDDELLAYMKEAMAARLVDGVTSDLVGNVDDV
ncbi:MAG: phosphoenolpyruvate--protein phosphotransferase [Nitrospinae bacterium]|nr:phosphoenolpyruvate--protein phosphotransferase [Nitrospinota bacterium]